MRSKRESLDPDDSLVHSFTHPGAYLFYTRAITAGARICAGDRGRIRSIDDRLARRYRVPTATQTDRPMSYDPAIVGYYSTITDGTSVWTLPTNV